MEFEYTIFLYNDIEKIIANAKIITKHQICEKMEISVPGLQGIVVRLVVERIHINYNTKETLLCCGMIIRLKDEHDGEYAVFPFSWFNPQLVKGASGWEIRPSTGADAFITAKRHVVTYESLNNFLESPE